MIFARASTIRSGLRFAQSARPAVTRPGVWKSVARRGYASGGHGEAKASSDLPWAIGGVAITVPVCYYILSSSGDEHHDEHGLHARSHDPEERIAGTDKGTGQAESEDDFVPDDTSDSSDDAEDKPEEKTDGGDATEEKGEQKPAGDEERVTKTAEEGDTNETRKHIPDAKGGNKKRVESGNAITQGKLGDKVEGREGGPDDTGAAAKEAGSLNHSQSGKQEGLSNTDTKHSYDIQNDPSKSKKGEGTPETSKTKGTVDVGRPQV